MEALTVKATGKRPLGWPRSRWEENIRMDLEYRVVITREDRNYWRAFMNAALKLRVSKSMELVIDMFICHQISMIISFHVLRYAYKQFILTTLSTAY